MSNGEIQTGKPGGRTMTDAVFEALINGKTLVSSDDQFRIRFDFNFVDEAPTLVIQHCSTTTWRYVKSFELAIIRYNSWRVLDE